MMDGVPSRVNVLFVDGVLSLVNVLFMDSVLSWVSVLFMDSVLSWSMFFSQIVSYPGHSTKNCKRRREFLYVVYL